VDRPFAPSPRRRALARAAGLVLVSPAWTAAIAVAAGIASIAAAATFTAGALTERTRTTLAGAADGDPVARATSTGAAAWAADVLAAAAPLLLACAAGAVVATAALARGIFVPSRRVRGAPALDDAPVTDAGLELARAAAVGAVAVGFVLAHLAPIAALTGHGAGSLAAALRALALGAAAHAVAAAVLVAVLDAIVRHQRLAAALRMTAREARDDAREAGHDPQRRRRLRDARAADPRERLRDASALLVGGDAVVAVRWTPGAAAPTVIAAGRGLDGRQLIAAARHRGVPALADDALAEALADRSGRGAVPAAHHARLARVLAAVI
jgi:flagellar biosynthetic protein FlhB